MPVLPLPHRKKRRLKRRSLLPEKKRNRKQQKPLRRKRQIAEAADTEAADEETEAAESGAAADSSEGEVSNLPQSIPGAKSGTRRVLPHEEKPSESTAKNDENSFPELNEVKAPAEITGNSVMFVEKQKTVEKKIKAGLLVQI